MSRAVVSRTIEIHYQSPNEMVAEISGCLDGGDVCLESSVSLPPGERREVVVNIPWLGRQVHLLGVVQAGDGAPETPRRLRVKLLDGPRGTLQELRELVGRFRAGAILEESREAATGGAPTQPVEQRIRAMSPSLRAMLAAKANPEERLVLSRDPDPRVLEFLLKNAGISIEEVRRIAARLNLHQGHFSAILRNPAWMGDEALRATLARNPRLPEFMAESVLAPLSTAVLKGLVDSMNTTAGTRRAAVRILQARGVVAGTRRDH